MLMFIWFKFEAMHVMGQPHVGAAQRIMFACYRSDDQLKIMDQSWYFVKPYRRY